MGFYRLSYGMAADPHTLLSWDVGDVVQFVEKICDTNTYSHIIRLNRVNGKALIFMTVEGWSDLGVTSLVHRHALVGWCKALLSGEENASSGSLQHQVNGFSPCIEGRVSNGATTHVLPASIPVTYERIFKPHRVKHMYPIVGKPFLEKFYKVQHASYCRSMDKIREWFKMGFMNMECREFSKINLRNNKETTRGIKAFIRSKLDKLELEPLFFDDDNVIRWEVDDAYAKVISWRHYQRSLDAKIHDSTHNLPSLIPPSLCENEIPIHARRRRCYAMDEGTPNDIVVSNLI